MKILMLGFSAFLAGCQNLDPPPIETDGPCGPGA
jgi:hypothetical protein